MRLFQDSDFAGDLKDSKSTLGGILCIFGSSTFVPISWMCKKQTPVTHSSTEGEIISLEAVDGIPALDLWNWVFEVFHYSRTNLIRPRIHGHRETCCITPRQASTPRIKPMLQPRTAVLICFMLTMCLRMRIFLSNAMLYVCKDNEAENGYQRQESQNETRVKNPQSCSWLVAWQN